MSSQEWCLILLQETGLVHMVLRYVSCPEPVNRTYQSVDFVVS